jgi:hypothetical protein
MLNIAGIDVSRNKVTVCILSCVPDDLKRFKQKWKPLTFRADREGINGLLALDFDAAVLEPTGHHYAKIWAKHLQEAGREVRWVGHWEVASYREGWKAFSKTDKADCIALACYGLERWDKSNMFLVERSRSIRDFTLQLEHLNRVKNPLINRLRQQLCHEFPEGSERCIQRRWLEENPAGILRAIAGEKISNKWEKEFSESIGTGVSTFAQGLARMICQLEQEELLIEQNIAAELNRPEYQRYLEVLNHWEMRDRIAAALLGIIFPIEQFLDQHQRQKIEHVESKNGKRVSRNNSMSAFKLSLGMGLIWVQSGDYEGWNAGGRADLRTSLWRWAKTEVVMRPNLENPRIKALVDYYKEGSTQIINEQETHFDPGKGNQKVMRVVRRAIERLFKDLARKCVTGGDRG